MSTPLLAIEDIHVVYDSAILAVAGVSLDVQPGEIVALLGANGAGKSSLLRAVSNILHAKRGRISQGSIAFDGKPILGVPTSRLVRTGLVQVLEGRHCFLQLSVEENLIAGAIGKGASRAETRESLGHVYDLFPALAPKRAQAAGLLSGGQQQMVAIGRALMSRPRLLVLDEPSMGLAPLLVAEIFQSLDRLNREEDLAILLAEQNAAVALRHAHRAVVLENGKISATGSAAELRCRDDIRAAYLGLPPSQITRSPELTLEGLKTMTIIDQKSTRPAETSQSVSPIPGVPRPSTPADIIRDDAQAIAVAERLAAQFKEGAAQRDRERIWPVAELDAFSQSGLWSINVPKAFGGPGLSYVTLNKVIEIISAADSSLGQIPQNHLGVVAAIATVSDDAQKKLLFAEVLRGTRFGNAFSEFGSKRAADFETKFTDAGDHVIVTGKKFYSTGALLAHLVPIVALDDEGRAWYAIADRDAPGLTVIDDWSSFGQRTTLSGTVILDNVKVLKTHLVPGYKGYEVPTADGAIFQVIQAAVDTGIARAAIEDTIAFVRSSSRAWVDSGVDHAWQDPYTIQAIGELRLKLLATQALLDKSGLAIDVAVAAPSEKTVAEAQIAVAAAKVFSTELAIAATNKLFELAGTRSTLAVHGLDRHWRNARTHTLHDPVRWKYAILGNYFLNGVNPPLHAWS